MNTLVKEFQDDTALIQEVERQRAEGVKKENLYVIAHDDERTNRIVEKADANKIGIEEEGLLNTVENIFRKKGDELRAKFREFGFNKLEAEALESKLDHGKILLLVETA